jgi:hypothetical protein
MGDQRNRIARLGDNMNPHFKKAGGWICGAVGAIVAALAGHAVAAVDENVEPLSWANSWSKGSVVVSNVVGSAARVAVHFPWSDPGWPPPRGTIYLVTGGSPETSPFAGDYVAGGMKHLAFKLSANTNVTLVSAILRSTTSGTEWKFPVQVPRTPNEWGVMTVPIEWDSRWYQNSPGDGNGGSWSQAIQSVSYVGVLVERSGFANQIVTVDSFILAGTGFITPPAHLLSFGDALEARFGVRNFKDLTASQKAQDLDGDGMKDVDEILAGTNPDNRNSVFAATVVSTTSSGVTIKWPSVSGGVYTVSRSRDLVGGVFGALADGYRLTATQDGFMEYTDRTVQANGGPYFYRVVRE